HGVPPSDRALAEQRRLKVIDATCPLVTKVHLEAIRYARRGYHVLYIGHRGHPEPIGTLGEIGAAQGTLIETLGEGAHGHLPNPRARRRTDPDHPLRPGYPGDPGAAAGALPEAGAAAHRGHLLRHD